MRGIVMSAGNYFRVENVVSLARKDRCQLIVPEFLHRGQDVIDHDVAPRGVALGDIIQHPLFMDIDQ